MNPITKRLTLTAGLSAALVVNLTHPVAAATKPSTKAKTKTAAKSTAAKSTAAKVDGSTVDTRWGPVKVSISIANRKITNITAPIYPHSKERSTEINDRALPLLRQEVLTAQSAKIDQLSGATVTWEGYTTSLQAAIDAAKQSKAL